MTYPKYQYSIFLKGSKDEQLVIRADTWEEFKKLKAKADIITKKVTATPYQQQPVKDVVEGQTCRKCQKAKMVLNPKTNKWFCEDKCWLKNKG